MGRTCSNWKLWSCWFWWHLEREYALRNSLVKIGFRNLQCHVNDANFHQILNLMSCFQANLMLSEMIAWPRIPGMLLALKSIGLTMNFILPWMYDCLLVVLKFSFLLGTTVGSFQVISWRIILAWVDQFWDWQFRTWTAIDGKGSV